MYIYTSVYFIGHRKSKTKLFSVNIVIPETLFRQTKIISHNYIILLVIKQLNSSTVITVKYLLRCCTS